MEKQTDKRTLKSEIKKALNQKKEVSKYLQGEITKEELEAQGIKLVKPF